MSSIQAFFLNYFIFLCSIVNSPLTTSITGTYFNTLLVLFSKRMNAIWLIVSVTVSVLFLRSTQKHSDNDFWLFPLWRYQVDSLCSDWTDDEYSGWCVVRIHQTYAVCAFLTLHANSNTKSNSNFFKSNFCININNEFSFEYCFNKRSKFLQFCTQSTDVFLFSFPEPHSISLSFQRNLILLLLFHEFL
jgi:hypothetical protein